MSIWEPIDATPIQEPAKEPPGEPLYCGCKIDGPRRNVLVDFEYGHINTIKCPDCKLSLPLVQYDELELVGGEDVPMVLTTDRGEYFNPLDMIYPEYDVWHTLTAREGQEADA